MIKIPAQSQSGRSSSSCLRPTRQSERALVKIFQSRFFDGLHHVEVDFSRFQARNLEHHVEVVITEFAEGDVDQLPVRVQVVHDRFRLSNLGSFLLFENYIEYTTKLLG